MNVHSLILDSVGSGIDAVCESSRVWKTEFRRGKYLYKIERIALTTI
jgi:hypothetical protein